TEVIVPPVGTGPTAPVVTTQAMVSEVEMFNTNLVVTTFNVDRSTVVALRQAGWSWGDIHLLANIASRTNRPIIEIANWRSQGLTYEQIAQRYNLTMAQLITPDMVRTRVAGFVTEYGYQPLYYRTDPWGNPVLTRFEAERLMRLGYDWQNIAIAANVSAETGANIRDVLSWIDRGYTWDRVAREYGLNIDTITDVRQYPFARDSGTMMIPTTAPVTPPTGAGPMVPGTTTVPPPVY
ncbi:MAG TPA: hypothetical protein PKV43_13955, partial [Armatimonadota bacterium]|nr:hypothetical protein [Armatimonadota bacterium]